MTEICRKLLRTHVDVDTDAKDNEIDLFCFGAHLIEESGYLPAVNQDVIWPFYPCLEFGGKLNGSGYGNYREESQLRSCNRRYRRPREQSNSIN